MNAPEDFEKVTTTLTRRHVDALLLTGQAAYLMRNQLGEFAIRQRLPSLVATRVSGTGGALISFGADFSDIWREAAIYVAKILNGAKPADLPVERPTKVELIINLKTAKAIGLTIPQANAVAAGYITSLARPGGNITGLTNLIDESIGKLIEFLHVLAPESRHIAILMNGNSPVLEQFWNVIQRACTSLNLTADRVLASAPEQLAGAVEQIVRQHSQAVVVPADPMFVAERVRLQSLVKATGLPAVYSCREFAALGGLLSYGPDLAAGFRYSAKFVDKILNGAKPADLPVEQPTTFELVINLKTAKAIGLTIPQSLLLRADQVIE